MRFQNRRLLNQKLLGVRIREARERAGVSQEELANAVSKDQRAISEYENGRRKLSVTDLPAFARTLKVPVLYFYEGDVALQDTDQAMLDEFRRLPTEEQRLSDLFANARFVPRLSFSRKILASESRLTLIV